MAKQVLNVGTSANDGTGDSLRAAAQKINSNFTEVYGSAQSAFSQANTGTTLAQSAYDFANTIVSDTQVDPLARTTSNTASNNITLIQGVNVTQNTRLDIIESVDVTQNTNITTVTNTATAAFIQANTGTTLAQAAYNYANTLVSDTFVDPLARETSNTASNNITVIQGVDDTQNTRLDIIEGTNATQNTRLDVIETVNNNQNNSITLIQGINDTQNTNITTATDTATAAFIQANSAADAASIATANIIFTDTTLSAPDAETLKIVVQDSNFNLNSLDLIVDDGNENVQTRVLLDRESIRFNVDLQDSNYTWTFDDSGTLTLPSNPTVTGNGTISLVNGQNANSRILVTPTGLEVKSASIDVLAGTDGTAHWAFNSDSSISFPDGSHQETAFTGYATDNTARELANSAADIAQGSYDAANTNATNITLIEEYANSAFAKANAGPVGIANASYSFSIADNGYLNLKYNDSTSLFLTTTGMTSYGQMVLEAANNVSGNNSAILFDRNGSGIAFRLEDNTPVSKNWGFYHSNVLFPDGTRQYTAATDTLAQNSFDFANTLVSSIESAAQTIPQNAQSTDYSLQLSDAGKHIYYTQEANNILYIPSSDEVSFANGTTIMIISQAPNSNVTVTPNVGVSMYLAGNTIISSRNVASYGMATLIQVAANTWFINGTGVS